MEHTLPLQPYQISFSSQVHLGRKYALDYTTDRWHEGQRDEALDGLLLTSSLSSSSISLSDSPSGGGSSGNSRIGTDPVEQATLVLCLMIAVGCNRFAFDTGGAGVAASGQPGQPAHSGHHPDQSSGMGVVDALRCP